MMQMWARGRRPDRAMHWFQQMLSHRVKPNAVTFTSLVGGFLRAGFHEEAAQVFESMVENCVGPTLDTYAALLVEYTHCGNADVADRLVGLMRKCGGPAHEVLRMILRVLRRDEEILWRDVG